jgi:hypothetical protein
VINIIIIIIIIIITSNSSSKHWNIVLRISANIINIFSGNAYLLHFSLYEIYMYCRQKKRIYTSIVPANGMELSCMNTSRDQNSVN